MKGVPVVNEYVRRIVPPLIVKSLFLSLSLLLDLCMACVTCVFSCICAFDTCLHVSSYVRACALSACRTPSHITQEREELSAAQASLELRTLSVAEADELKAANEALKSKVTALQQVMRRRGVNVHYRDVG